MSIFSLSFLLPMMVTATVPAVTWRVVYLRNSKPVTDHNAAVNILNLPNYGVFCVSRKRTTITTSWPKSPIHCMRHLFLIFMIALLPLLPLLPLRGWAGDAMATGMAAGPTQQMQQTHVATENIAAHARPASEKADFDHETAAPDANRTVADCAVHGAEDTDHAGDASLSRANSILA